MLTVRQLDATITSTPFWVITKLSTHAKRQLLARALKTLSYGEDQVLAVLSTLQDAPGKKIRGSQTIFGTLSKTEALVLRRLIEAHVQFIVVAGYAVRAYLDRKANDLDILLSTTKDNIERAYGALSNFSSGVPNNFANSLVEGKSVEIGGVEFLPDYSGRKYSDLEGGVTTVPYGEGEVQIMGRMDLLAIKREKTREKDIKDARDLERTLKTKA